MNTLTNFMYRLVVVWLVFLQGCSSGESQSLVFSIEPPPLAASNSGADSISDDSISNSISIEQPPSRSRVLLHVSADLSQYSAIEAGKPYHGHYTLREHAHSLSVNPSVDANGQFDIYSDEAPTLSLLVDGAVVDGSVPSELNLDLDMVLFDSAVMEGEQHYVRLWQPDLQLRPIPLAAPISIGDIRYQFGHIQLDQYLASKQVAVRDGHISFDEGTTSSFNPFAGEIKHASSHDGFLYLILAGQSACSSPAPRLFIDRTRFSPDSNNVQGTLYVPGDDAPCSTSSYYPLRYDLRPLFQQFLDDTETLFVTIELVGLASVPVSPVPISERRIYVAPEGCQIERNCQDRVLLETDGSLKFSGSLGSYLGSYVTSSKQNIIWSSLGGSANLLDDGTVLRSELIGELYLGDIELLVDDFIKPPESVPVTIGSSFEDTIMYADIPGCSETGDCTSVMIFYPGGICRIISTESLAFGYGASNKAKYNIDFSTRKLSTNFFGMGGEFSEDLERLSVKVAGVQFGALYRE